MGAVLIEGGKNWITEIPPSFYTVPIPPKWSMSDYFPLPFTLAPYPKTVQDQGRLLDHAGSAAGKNAMETQHDIPKLIVA